MKAHDDGAVELYCDGTKKFETQANGVTVTGGVYSDGFVGGDNDKVELGDSGDLKIWHDGSSTSYVSNSGLLRIRGSEVRLSNTSNSTYFTGTSGGSAKVYFNDAVKLETTNDGTVTSGIATVISTGVVNAMMIQGIGSHEL